MGSIPDGCLEPAENASAPHDSKLVWVQPLKCYETSIAGHSDPGSPGGMCGLNPDQPALASSRSPFDLHFRRTSRCS